MPDFGYQPVPLDTGMEFVGVFLILILGVYFLMFAFMILSYVLQSLGMYTIAKRRCIRNPWLAWLPVGNMWILGSISDQYQYVAKGKIKNKRKVLLGSMIAIYALMIPIYLTYFAMMIQGIIGADSLDGNYVLPYLGLIGTVSVVLLVIALIGGVIQYIALYDLYVSCDSNNAVAYLLLSIFINVTLPFLVFACRKKDLGMPPRKEDVAAPRILESEVLTPAETPVTEEVTEE